MKAIQLFDKEDLRLVELPKPTIQADEILVRVKAAALCGTDVRMFKNGAAGATANHPLTLGHEFAGIIEEVGAQVEIYKVGMGVCLQPNIGCGVCARCIGGQQHLCNDYRAFGINLPGAFAEYVVIPEDAVKKGNVAIIPEGVSFAEAAIAEPLSCVYNGFLKCNVKPGEFALVVGAGPIGIMHAMLLDMAGAIVIVTDLSAERLSICKTIMPSVEIYSGDLLKSFINKKTEGRGLDIAVTANPSPQAQTGVLELMNYGGRINFFGGVPKHLQPVPLDTNLIHYRELIVTGSTRSSLQQYRRVLEFISHGLVKVEALVTHTYDLTDFKHAFDNALQAQGIKHIFVF